MIVNAAKLHGKPLLFFGAGCGSHLLLQLFLLIGKHVQLVFGFFDLHAELLNLLHVTQACRTVRADRDCGRATKVVIAAALRATGFEDSGCGDALRTATFATI